MEKYVYYFNILFETKLNWTKKHSWIHSFSDDKFYKLCSRFKWQKRHPHKNNFLIMFRIIKDGVTKFIWFWHVNKVHFQLLSTYELLELWTRNINFIYLSFHWSFIGPLIQMTIFNWFHWLSLHTFVKRVQDGNVFLFWQCIYCT